MALPQRDDSLAKALGQTHQLNAQWFNRRSGRSGHLWQNRFYSCALGRNHRRRALAYVDLNPVRAGIVPDATEYPWSSARAHVEGRDGNGLLKLSLWQQLCPLSDWREVIGQREACGDGLDKLRVATRTGRPWGEREFEEELEKRLGKRLRAGSPGRPRNTQALAATTGSSFPGK